MRLIRALINGVLIYDVFQSNPCIAVISDSVSAVVCELHNLRLEPCTSKLWLVRRVHGTLGSGQSEHRGCGLAATGLACVPACLRAYPLGQTDVTNLRCTNSYSYCRCILWQARICLTDFCEHFICLRFPPQTSTSICFFVVDHFLHSLLWVFYLYYFTVFSEYFFICINFTVFSEYFLFVLISQSSLSIIIRINF